MKYALFLVFLMFFVPISIHAEEANGTLYFGGGTSNSNNFQVSGVVTDISNNLDFPSSEVSGDSDISPDIATQSSISPVIPATQSQGILNLLIRIAQAIKIPFAVSALVIGAILLVSEAIINLPWLSIGSNIWSRIIALFGFYNKKKKWGTVYDAESRQPIAFAAVRVFERNNNKLLETQMTDKDGRFGFLARPGKYYLQVVKNNYFFPSKITPLDYHGDNIEIKQNQSIIANIPMDPEFGKLSNRLNFVINFFHILENLQIFITIIGTIISVYFYVSDQNLINFSILMLYLLLWFYTLIQLRKSKSFGVVEDNQNKNAIPMAIIRLFDANTKKLIATRVTAQNGNYLYLINAGYFSLNVTKEAYEQYFDNLYFKYGDVLTKDILMKKQF